MRALALSQRLTRYVITATFGASAAFFVIAVVVGLSRLNSEARESHRGVNPFELERAADLLARHIESHAASNSISLGAMSPSNRATRASIRVAPIVLTQADDGAISAAEPQPAAEITRRAKEADRRSETIRVEAGDFECSPRTDITQISPSHFRLRIAGTSAAFWRVVGASGAIVRFDVEFVGSEPLYAGLSEVVPAVSEMSPSGGSAASAAIDLRDAKWRPVDGVWHPAPKCISVVHTFSSDRAYVSLRPPRLPSHDAAMFSRLAASPNARVIQLGASPAGNPLSLAMFGSVEAAASRPCVLVYSGEHADECDAKWVAEGVADFLASDDEAAQAIRETFNVLVIPDIDPDAAKKSAHDGIICSFTKSAPSPESAAYERWIRQWLEGGGRIDLVINLHAGAGSGSPQLFTALCEGNGTRGKVAVALNDSIGRSVAKFSHSVRLGSSHRGISRDRLSGWLTRCSGAFAIAYEVDSQSAARLTVSGLKELGQHLVIASCAAIAADGHDGILSHVDRARAALQTLPKGSDLFELVSRDVQTVPRDLVSIWNEPEVR